MRNLCKRSGISCAWSLRRTICCSSSSQQTRGAPCRRLQRRSKTNRWRRVLLKLSQLLTSMHQQPRIHAWVKASTQELAKLCQIAYSWHMKISASLLNSDIRMSFLLSLKIWWRPYPMGESICENSKLICNITEKQAAVASKAPFSSQRKINHTTTLWKRRLLLNRFHFWIPTSPRRMIQREINYKPNCNYKSQLVPTQVPEKRQLMAWRTIKLTTSIPQRASSLQHLYSSIKSLRRSRSKTIIKAPSSSAKYCSRWRKPKRASHPSQMLNDQIQPTPHRATSKNLKSLRKISKRLRLISKK